jgi:hypothetical protein
MLQNWAPKRKGDGFLPKVFDYVMDGLDIETFIACDSEEEGRQLANSLLQELGFSDYDIVFIQFHGPGVRLRARAYLHRSGDRYGWLIGERERGK